jgi:hypothetical protein
VSAQRAAGNPQASTDALAAPRILPLDLAMAAAVALDAAGSILAARLAVGWISAAILDLLVGGWLLMLLARRAWRPVVGRLLLMGLMAGILELVTDAAGERFAHSLVYPRAERFLWASPIYMPVAWMVVLAPLGYLAWRLGRTAPRLPLGAIMSITGIWSALNIPFYEEMAYAAQWWHYTDRLRFGHTPLYVIAFEGLIGAALPILVRGLERLPTRSVVWRGVALGAWMPCAALLAWLPLGR